MGERKVLNKYYPPDFDPSNMPRLGKRAPNPTNEMKVRMMLPMSVRCNTCGNFMYKGTKFNTRKEDVLGEEYLGLRVFRFYWRCTQCAAEFSMKTDPKNADYVLEQGATRNYEPWRDKERQAAAAAQTKEAEEAGNAMKALENRTAESKREMDILSALDEMRTLNARHNKVTAEEALEALQREAERMGGGGGGSSEGGGEGGGAGGLDPEDAEALKEFFALRAANVRRLDDDEEEEEGEEERGGVAARARSASAGPSGASAAAAAAGPNGGSMGPPPSSVAAATQPAAGPAVGSSKLPPLSALPFKVVVKAKRAEPAAAAAAAAATAEASSSGGGGGGEPPAKKLKGGSGDEGSLAQDGGGGGVSPAGAAASSGDNGGNLLGLLAGYGSDSSGGG